MCIRDRVDAARVAPHSLIVDQAGRPLVSNRTSVVVTVDRLALQQEPDNGATVITRLADILDMPVEKITDMPDYDPVLACSKD